MEIPRELPQFDNTPTLFLVSAEFETVFYLAKNGHIFELEKFGLNPREEAQEKQAFVGKKGGMQSLSAVSHRDRYVEELKVKFLKKISALTDKILNQEKIEAIQIFVPSHVENKLIESLSKKAQDLTAEIHTGQYTNNSSLDFLEFLKNDLEKARSTKHIHLTEEEKNILHKPQTRPGK